MIHCKIYAQQSLQFTHCIQGIGLLQASIFRQLLVTTLCKYRHKAYQYHADLEPREGRGGSFEEGGLWR